MDWLYCEMRIMLKNKVVGGRRKGYFGDYG